MKKFIFVLLISCLFGCSTSNSNLAGKSLLSIKESIVNTRESISIPCQKQIISKQDCQTIDEYYLKSKLVYDSAVDASIVAISTGDLTLYNKQRESLNNLLLDMTKVLNKYGKEVSK